MAPYDLAPMAHTLGYDLIFLLLGMGFGAALELSGFGDSRKLAAQFYLREMTVLKVMFTAIVVAAVLIGLASSLELLDLNRVWVNPTYLAPGIVGGLIMGVGFIIGGFCPGTSLVGAATLKVDGIFFVLGVVMGVGLFGETVGGFTNFFHSTFMGRFTIPEWLGLPYGVTLILLVVMALGMFWAAELSEAYFGARKAWKDIVVWPERRIKVLASGLLLLLALFAALVGQPGVSDRWEWMAEDGERQIRERDVLVDPAEVVELRKDLTLRVDILDVRDEREFNLFHLAGARRVAPEAAHDPELVKTLLAAPDNVIVFVMSADEARAIEVWRALKAQGVLNLYVVAGGVNGWLDRYPPSACVAVRRTESLPGERMQWDFRVAVGQRSTSAHPELPRQEYVPACDLATGIVAPPGTSPDGVATPDGHRTVVPPPDLVRKVKLQRKVIAKGGCG